MVSFLKNGSEPELNLVAVSAFIFCPGWVAGVLRGVFSDAPIF